VSSDSGWRKYGRFLKPDPKIDWMATFTGSSFAVSTGVDDIFDVYVTGRDKNNRSLIGIVKIDLKPFPTVLEISNQPVLELGEPGTFDENGTSYPCLVQHQGELFMYYTGWTPTVMVPFQNHIGLAQTNVQRGFERVSRAPILERTNDDPISTGSCFVATENGLWRMWYTCFVKWGSQPDEPKHVYVIKYAESKDGITWHRNNQICIDLTQENEFSICSPSVIKHNDLYHMWYCYKGEKYRIGYATSEEGRNWKCQNGKVGISPSSTGWDSEEMCYPHVFGHKGKYYMIYCGNNYGEEGLGLAVLDASLMSK